MAKARSCSLTCHTLDPEMDIQVHSITQRRFVPAPMLEYMQSEKLIKDFRKNREYFACVDCIDKLTDKIRKTSKRGKSNTSQSPTPVAVPKPNDPTGMEAAVAMVCSALEKNELCADNISKIVSAVSQRIITDLSNQPARKANERQQEIFANSYSSVWACEPDLCLKKLLTALASGRNDLDGSKFRMLVKANDGVRALVDERYISNFAVGETMLLLQFSKSRYAIDLFCKTCPSGSFSTISRTIAALSKPSVTLPDSDVIIAFDNNQIVQRTWAIKYKNKMVVSTVTTMVYFDEKPSTRFQFTLDIPTALFPNQDNKLLLMQRYTEFKNSSNQICRTFRRKFIEDRILEIMQSCSVKNGTLEDSVSEDKSPTVFSNSLSYDRVSKLDKCHEIIDLDCLQENPNSYLAVGKVFDKILEFSSQTGRIYVPVYCDGSPYSIGIKILKETYTCSVCDKRVLSNATSQHEDEHTGEQIKWTRTYKRILLRPGNGHLEMTGSKALLQVMWDPIIKPIARIMGFATDSSLNYCKSGFDHHKSFDLLMVVFAALSDEVIFPFVKECVLQNKTPKYEDFCTWEEERKRHNLTFRIASDFALTTLHSLQLFRSAIRNCNDEIALAAREKLSDIFFITNNYKYQDIVCNDTLYLLSLSPASRRIVGRESSRRTGGEMGEGYDFLLENRNKLYKSFLPSDSAPTFEQWLQVTRTARDLVKLRQAAAERLEMTLKTGVPSHHKLGKEVHEARKFIRSTGILEKTVEDFVSLEEKPIKFSHISLSYVQQSEKNKRLYFESFCENTKIQLPILKMEQEVDISKLSISEMKDVISTKIAALREPNQSFFKKSLKNVKEKKDYVEFFSAVHGALETQNELEFQESIDDFCRTMESESNTT